MVMPEKGKAAFELSAEVVDGATVVHVTGEIDLATSERLSDELSLAAANGGPVVVDLTECGFIDSSGIRALLVGTRAAEEHDGRLLLAGASPHVRRVLELTGLGEAVPMHPGVDEALRDLAAD
ncbi:MAG: STAS domain-containing protein [Actinomycetota bacterium]|nr:STAS domain-containing protein [Actinomycetota bacterium]